MPLSIFLAKPIEIGLTWAAEKAADAVILSRLADRAAKAELVKIAKAAIGVAAKTAPTLAADLRSPAFINWVLAPALLDALKTRSAHLTARDLAHAYAERFLQPFLRERKLSGTLQSLFRLTPAEFEGVFEVFLTDLRPRLYGSRHWREPVQDLAIEEIRVGLLGLPAAIRALPAPGGSSDAEWEAARRDARTASSDLRAWEQRIHGRQIDRPEFAILKDRIVSSPAAATLLIGASGAGKSALLAQLTAALEDDGITVFAIKADLLPSSVQTLTDVARALGIEGDILAEVDALARRGPVVVLIDQLDAVSEVMDRSSRRMTLLLQLANRWSGQRGRSEAAPVHVVVSSRPFEASHDARFKTLEAETVELALPPFEKVEDLLGELEIEAATIRPELRETLRRPFHLKLFVDIVRRGGRVDALAEGELLNAWLASAQLGGEAARADVMTLLTALAEEMTTTETLWRPADRFMASQPAAVRRAEACELVIRKGDTLGFAHQTWLDDFQARSFLTPDSLAAHAWATQDGLFGRSTILRALERLRRVEPTAYAAALDALLGDTRTRRHLRHLTVDFIAVQETPQPRELAWIQRLLREDAALGLRAANRVVERWSSWRAGLGPLIGAILQNPDGTNIAAALSTAEALADPVAGDRLLTTVWADPAYDSEVLDIIWRANLWTDGTRARLGAILDRTKLAPHWIAHLATGLAEAGRAVDAAEVLAIYLAHQDAGEDRRHELHGLERVWTAAPLAFARAVLPWFLRVVALGKPDREGVRMRYPNAYTLPYNWQEDDKQGEVLAGVQDAVNRVAQGEPEAFMAIVAELAAIEIDDVQGVIAEGFAAAGAGLAKPALDWLLADPRRLHVGHAHAQDSEGTFGVVYGYSTGRLLVAVAPHLNASDLSGLVAAIEAWDGYHPSAYEDTRASERRDMRGWSEGHRVRLLALLPTLALAPRRRRQVAELVKADRRPLTGQRTGRILAGFSRSRMSADEMARATDEQIFGMLETVPDNGSAQSKQRRHFLEGGASELAQTFAAFAKANPARALAMARDRFVAGRQERAAGTMVRDLSGEADVDAEVLLILVRDLNARGFASPGWQLDAGWALENLAGRRDGLGEPDVRLLESWLNTDPASLAEQTTRRKANEDQNRERNRAKQDPRPAEALLFGHGLRGLVSIPQDNNTFLSAIGAGLTLREPPDHEAWLQVLERHLERPEDPAIWTAVFRRHACSLHHSDPARVAALLEKLFDRHPEAFGIAASHEIWRHRRLFPTGLRVRILLSWLLSGEEGLQLAGEYATALALIEPEDTETALLAAVLRRRDADPAKVGTLFGAAVVWRETDDHRRRAAHEILLDAAPTAEGAEADAVSSAIDMDRSLPPDALTRALLEAARDNPSLLKACLNRRFVQALQELLLHPGFEALVLEVSDRSADLLLAARGRGGRFVDQEFVAIAITLQRSAGPLRPRAMDLYEKLLDAGVYGAAEAARASLRG